MGNTVDLKQYEPTGKLLFCNGCVDCYINNYNAYTNPLIERVIRVVIIATRTGRKIEFIIR